MGAAIRAMKKLLVIADMPGWAFDRIYKGLKNNCVDWSVDVFYLNTSQSDPGLLNYDLILYLCDNFPDPIVHWVRQGLPKERVVMAIRSEVTHPLYNNKNILLQLCEGLIASNEMLYERFKCMHNNVFLAEGGVDTDFYSYKKKRKTDDINVGWAGSTGVFDREFRGLDIIQEACDLAQVKFNPALKEVRMRSPEEMVEYYHNDIDIYVEMSKGAGRQNGLVEAGSCGIPIISYKCGIAKQLIKQGVNGFIIEERDSKLLAELITKTLNDYDNLAFNIRESIVEGWSWKLHAKKFEKAFNSLA